MAPVHRRSYSSQLSNAKSNPDFANDTAIGCAASGRVVASERTSAATTGRSISATAAKCPSPTEHVRPECGPAAAANELRTTAAGQLSAATSWRIPSATGRLSISGTELSRLRTAARRPSRRRSYWTAGTAATRASSVPTISKLWTAISVIGLPIYSIAYKFYRLRSLRSFNPNLSKTTRTDCESKASREKSDDSRDRRRDATSLIGMRFSCSVAICAKSWNGQTARRTFHSVKGCIS